MSLTATAANTNRRVRRVMCLVLLRALAHGLRKDHQILGGGGRTTYYMLWLRDCFKITVDSGVRFVTCLGLCIKIIEDSEVRSVACVGLRIV